MCRCVARLQSCGLKVLGDCVLNHRCASHQDSKGIWNQYGGRLDWDARAIVRDDRKFGGKGVDLFLKDIMHTQSAHDDLEGLLSLDAELGLDSAQEAACERKLRSSM